jgi:hypothetical protein
MKKLIALGLTFGLTATALAFADATPTETQPVTYAAPYISLGIGPLPIPMPLFGVGGRFQSGHHGADLSFQGITWGSSNSTILKENIDYLYYFKPNLSSQFYMGAGVSFTEFDPFRKCQTFLSPQLLVGKQYTNESGDVRFFQAQIEPVYAHLNKTHSKHWLSTFPSVILTYGICF